MAQRRVTTKAVDLISQLVHEGQLKLAPEFQRNAVWPRAAKAYLIDTILSDRPMPLFFFQRGRSAQTGKPQYQVVDGQQRIRAIIEFLDDRFSLTESADKKIKGKKFSQLPDSLRSHILNYDLSVEELSDYSDDEIKDVFVRMNRYVVKLSPQELRHAKGKGAFHDFVEDLGRLGFWRKNSVFTPLQLTRMKAVEFSAELAILLIEGPQDKKSSVDLYYGEYQKRFVEGPELVTRITAYFSWIEKALPNFSQIRFRKPVDLYGLIGALDEVSVDGTELKRLNSKRCGLDLIKFAEDVASNRPSKQALRYLASTSQQTDNIEPRLTRIRILKSILLPDS